MSTYRKNYSDAYLAAITGVAIPSTWTNSSIIEAADKIADSIAKRFADRMDNLDNDTEASPNE